MSAPTQNREEAYLLAPTYTTSMSSFLIKSTGYPRTDHVMALRFRHLDVNVGTHNVANICGKPDGGGGNL